ncbi:hypothetical protein JW824_07890 [bacterium]|nr:hypothetical protein [bacterium]
MMKDRIWIGIDIGSISLKMALYFRGRFFNNSISKLIDSQLFFMPGGILESTFDQGSLLLSRYIRHQGDPFSKVVQLFTSIFQTVDKDQIVGVWVTGSGGKMGKQIKGFCYLNEYRTTAEAVGRLFPEINTVFEMGGERSKYLLLSKAREDQIQILDYQMNGECAAGTGAFFDQQVERLKVRIEDVGRIVEGLEKFPSIAGRCSVFAKSDMIHAQQRGYQPAEVLKGLCEAVVRNFMGSVTNGKRIEPKVALIGGLAFNLGIVNALENQFNFFNGELFIPEHHAWMGAIGGILLGLKQEEESWSSERLSSQLVYENKKKYPTSHPLSLENVQLLGDQVIPYHLPQNCTVDGYLGIDVGSVSTNLALIDSKGELIHGIYRMTEGRPVDVVKDSVRELSAIVKGKVQIKGVGTTGSGREMIGALVGADVIKDEITAHKTGAFQISEKYFGSQVDTIFEIGGQDSKFISLKDGIVVDFSLNEACAAGTGSFLEEQAKQIGISIREEFADLALRSQHPLKLGERCTVFMQKEVVPYLQQGIPKEDVVAGLALSVVQNYLNRVVKKRKIGDVIFFQGGTAYNDSVAAAFATILKKTIIVPPHNGIIGAIGAALLAKEHMESKEKTSFRGWDMGEVSWKLREFICQGCSNHCTIQEFEVEGEKSYWGDKCSDRYRKRTVTKKQASIPDCISLYLDLLLKQNTVKYDPIDKKRGRMGIPRSLQFYDRFPFWKTYFESLGFDIVLSGLTRKDIVHAGLEVTVTEPCFPIQVAMGHLVDLLSQNLDFIFLPNVVNEEDFSGGTASYICPWSQTIPMVALHTPAIERIRDILFYPNIQFREGCKFVEKQLQKEVNRWGIGAKENRCAVRSAYQAQERFKCETRKIGRDVLSQVMVEERSCVILLGRPYNLYDFGLNLNIPKKLRDLYGVNVLPMGLLPLDGIDVRPVHDHMFWNYGRQIIQAAMFTKGHQNMHVVYLSNFKCGPDSYIRHYIEEASGKPFLFLQLDSHANDAGMMTRVEAFLESKGML